VTEFIIVIPDLAAAQALKPYMLGIESAHLLSNSVLAKGYPVRVRVPVRSAAEAVQAYPHIRAYGSEKQIMRLERIILRGGLALPIPTLGPMAEVDDLVGLDDRYAMPCAAQGSTQ
jgi:hypothetical protein